MKHAVIFARRPQLGRVKSRLAADIGSVNALRFYRSTLSALCRRLSAGGSWQTWLGVTPDASLLDARIWPAAIPRLPQGYGDLGARMERMLELFGPNPVLIVGSDIPDVSARHIAAAFEALHRRDLVFGPSADGGYWLVGARRGCDTAGLFEGVRWSGPEVLGDTMKNAQGKRIALLDELDDIDDGSSYQLWSSRR